MRPGVLEATMCTGGRLLADFVAGTSELPDVPDVVARALTKTVDDEWVVWAYKLAHRSGDGFTALTGGTSYPHDARAECRRGYAHPAPSPGCSCGFHAVSDRSCPFLSGGGEAFGLVRLEVALTGRVLVFEWMGPSLLLRAERQTVMRVNDLEATRQRRPDDPSGRLARRHPSSPRDIGPIRLAIPRDLPAAIDVDDDCGFCATDPLVPAERGRLALVGV
jgi:hypothetical protein